MRVLAVLQASRQALASHDTLNSSFFWVGAVLAFTPVVIILGILCYVWWNRRKASQRHP